MPSLYFLRKEDAINRAKPVLKCLDGPANIVRPGVIPPSTEPDNATLIIGTGVGIISFFVKILLSSNVEVRSIVLFLINLSLSNITTPICIKLNHQYLIYHYFVRL